MATTPFRQVRAEYDESTVTVYQAYSPRIADPAVAAGTFVAPFKIDRMTWIKPSFLWMMYRCGWATKPDQERVLAISITRAGFDEALAGASLSHFEAGVHTSHDEWLRQKESSPVRVQWDPERNLRLDPLPWRAIQIGLSGVAAHQYVSQWITDIRDVTELVHQVKARLDSEGEQAVQDLLPVEIPYPLAEETARKLGA